MTTVKICQLRATKAIGASRFHIHALECRDANNERKYRDALTMVDVHSVDEVAIEWYPPDNFDYDPATDSSYRDDFVVFPCVDWREESA